MHSAHNQTLRPLQIMAQVSNVYLLNRAGILRQDLTHNTTNQAAEAGINTAFYDSQVFQLWHKECGPLHILFYHEINYWLLACKCAAHCQTYLYSLFCLQCALPCYIEWYNLLVAANPVLWLPFPFMFIHILTNKMHIYFHFSETSLSTILGSCLHGIAHENLDVRLLALGKLKKVLSANQVVFSTHNIVAAFGTSRAL